MGFPQGGVCSAQFWIIAFDEAAKILNSNGVNGELFADDGNEIIGGKDIENMAQKLSRVGRDLSAWGKNADLPLTQAKQWYYYLQNPVQLERNMKTKNK